MARRPWPLTYPRALKTSAVLAVVWVVGVTLLHSWGVVGAYYGLWVVMFPFVRARMTDAKVQQEHERREAAKLQRDVDRILAKFESSHGGRSDG